MPPRTVGEPLTVAVFYRWCLESRRTTWPHLYVPKDLVAPAPAVIYVPGHGQRDGYHRHSVSYSAHGYVALNMPAIGDEGKTGAGMGCGHKAPYYNKYHWYNTGYNPAGAEVWDGVRAVDHLLSLRDQKSGKPLVDPARIGIVGRPARSRARSGPWPPSRDRAGVAVEGFTTVANYRVALPSTCDVHIFPNFYGLNTANSMGWPPRVVAGPARDHGQALPQPARRRLPEIAVRRAQQT